VLDLYTELRRIAEAFDGAGIPYALVGGLAVSIYTTPRATEDIDVLIAPHDLRRAVTQLEPLGFRPAGHPMRVAAGRLEIQRLTKIEGSDLLPLDLVLPAETALAEILAGRTEVDLEGQRLWVVGLDGLRALKRLRGSAQDQADLEALGPEQA
jgi:CheY-like chemotaxis protein